MSRKSILVLLALLLSPGVCVAAEEAALAGKVIGKNGEPLPGATLVLANDALALQEQATRTDADGGYRFTHLPPGAGYRLTVSMPGYATLVLTDITLEAGSSQQQSVALRPESEMKETVRVQAKSETLDTERVTGSTTFTSSFIADLPILGRDYQEVLVLAPGVTDVDKTGNPNIHGARDTDVITLVDGVSTTDPFTGYFGQNLNIESIQELEVITSAATAQYSRAQGGFASILTKSGGNEFQGTFKFYLRSDRLDGDGAGIEKADLTGGLLGDKAYTQQHFTDLMPFLSLSGAMVRDKLWYYTSLEYIHEETPVNAGSQAYVTPTYGNRAFGKLTWQLAPTQKLAFSLIADKTREENLGINSLTDAASGYTFSRGGPTYTLKESSVFRPTMILESTLAWFDNRFSQTPTTSLDTNGNGLLFVDNRPDLGGNQDGILEAFERDPGEDWDGNGSYAVFEDLNHNGAADPGEDLDRSGDVGTKYVICEGYQHEDKNCNGYLDSEADTNLNGVLDPNEDAGIPCDPAWLYCPGGTLPGTAHNGRLDTEDANGNGVLDVVGNSGYTPFPFWHDSNGNGIPDKGEFHAPLPPDRDLVRDRSGRLSGPSPYEYHDHRSRLSWVEDLSFFVNGAGGTHDVKAGMAYENEGYNSDTMRMPIFIFPTGIKPVKTPPGGGIPSNAQVFESVLVSMAVPPIIQNSASGKNLGFYLQDSWKPVPNLTVGLGLRFDHEDLSSDGFTFFDPVAERRTFNALMSVSGTDMDLYDPVATVGLCLDPIHSCVGSADIPLQTMNSQLRTLAFNRFTRSEIDYETYSNFLKGVTGSPTLPGGGRVLRQPEPINITNSNLAPRLSLSWDPWADGKTMAFGSWGRYYDKIFLNATTLEQGPDTVARTYFYDSSNGGFYGGLPDHKVGGILSQSSVSAYQIDRSLATPYSDEWTAGFRRELAPEVLISLRYIHRDFHHQLQDVDVNHQTRIDPYTGKMADHLGEPNCYSGLNCENSPNGAPDLYVQNLYFNRIYRLGNSNEQTYHAWEMELVRRLSRKWQMEASYTYSVAQGDAESYLSVLGNDPALTEFEPGYLNYDQRHVVKFNAVAFLPRDWRLGGTITWASGLPFSEIVHYNDLDDVGYAQSRILYGQLGPAGYGITPENRNIHRNAASYLLNTRVTKNFTLGKSSAAAFLEIYNLLNDDALRVFYIDQIPATYIYSGQGQPIQIHPTSEVVGERDFGRRFQIGFQLNF